ncbi:MAG: hypothetical protein ABIY51_14720 [Ferruginibacter sp.]
MELTIPLEQSSNSSYRIVSFFILAMHALLFGYFFLRANEYQWLLLAGCLINFLSIGLFFLPAVLQKKTKYFFSATLILTAFTWWALGNILMGILLCVLVVMNFYSRKKPVVYFTDEYILYPSFPPRKFYWKDVQDVIIKDDILTIDLKNNALIQQKIESRSIESMDMRAFNDLIRKNLQ